MRKAFGSPKVLTRLVNRGALKLVTAADAAQNPGIIRDAHKAGMTGLANAALSNSMTGMVRRAAAGAYSWLNSKQLAAAMADPNGRAALLQLQKLPPGAAKAREITAYLAALGGVRDTLPSGGNEDP